MGLRLLWFFLMVVFLKIYFLRLAQLCNTPCILQNKHTAVACFGCGSLLIGRFAFDVFTCTFNIEALVNPLRDNYCFLCLNPLTCSLVVIFSALSIVAQIVRSHTAFRPCSDRCSVIQSKNCPTNLSRNSVLTWNKRYHCLKRISFMFAYSFLLLVP